MLVCDSFLPIIKYDYEEGCRLVSGLLTKFMFTFSGDIDLYLSLVYVYREIFVTLYCDCDVSKFFSSDFCNKLYIPHLCNIKSFKKVLVSDSKCSSCILHDCLLEPKIDGVMVSLYFYNRSLLLAVTKGDKFGGEDVTNIVSKVIGCRFGDYCFDESFVYGVFFNMLLLGLVEIRGELYLPVGFFKQYLSHRYVSPRCAVVGLINNDSGCDAYCNLLCFTAYDLGLINKLIFGLGQEDTYRLISLLGLNVVGYVYCSELRGLANAYNTVVCDYCSDLPIDGIVVKTNAFEEQYADLMSFKLLLGYLFAVKKVDLSYTYIRSISCGVGKNGVISFLAVVDIVSINNISCNKVNLYSYGVVKSHSIGVGDYIEVVYNGLFLFSKVICSACNSFSITSCPVCGEGLTLCGLNLFCVNYRCHGRLVALLSNFFKKAGVFGISKRTINILVSAGLVSSAIGVFDLVNKYDQIVRIKGIGKSKAVMIVSEVNKLVSNISCTNIVMLLGLYGLGDKGALLIAPYLNSLLSDDFASIIDEMKCLNILQKKSLLLFLSNGDNRGLLSRLLLLLENVKN